MGYVKRTECPFCECAFCVATGIGQFSKVGVKPPPGSQIVECTNCTGQYTDIVCDEPGFESMYTKNYLKQVQGLRRFMKVFGDDIDFTDHVVLEIGGGEVGVRSICESYYAIDLRGDDTIFTGMFENTPDEIIAELRENCVDTIVTCDCIEHVLYPRAFFKKAAAVLSEGGVMYMHVGESKGTNVPWPLEKRQAAHMNCPSDLSMALMAGDRFVPLTGGKGDPGWIFKRTGI